MLTTDAVTSSSLKRAIEDRDGRTLSSFYADDALLRIIDSDNTPSAPRELRGIEAITAFWDDVCGREMTHQVDMSISEGNRMAFTENCAYPDGTTVFCMSTIELENGKIARQTVVQAWDD